MSLTPTALVQPDDQSGYAASAWETTSGYLLLVSLVVKERIDLVLFEQVEPKGKLQSFLRSRINDAKSLLPLDALALRSNVTTEWGSLMTAHVMCLHRETSFDEKNIIAHTAWRYATLTAWGEPSAVRELAIDFDVSINTIRNRLQLARERGILPSPGQGARFGR
jgi:hypothetical protein